MLIRLLIVNGTMARFDHHDLLTTDVDNLPTTKKSRRTAFAFGSWKPERALAKLSVDLAGGHGVDGCIQGRMLKVPSQLWVSLSAIII